MDTQTEPAIFSAYGLCDAKLEHEHALITDGSHAYAWSTGPEGVEAEAVLIDGHLASLDCTRQDHRNDGPCPGRIEWRLDDEFYWLRPDGAARGVYAAAACVLARSGKLAER